MQNKLELLLLPVIKGIPVNVFEKKECREKNPFSKRFFPCKINSVTGLNLFIHQYCLSAETWGKS